MIEEKTYYNLEDDIRNSPETIALFADDQFCKNLWGSFANIDWIKSYDASNSDEEQIIERLTDNFEHRIWGKSFRGMGAFIARIRNEFHGKSEDYMDWYCSSTYGVVYDDVQEALKKIGWEPYLIY